MRNNKHTPGPWERVQETVVVTVNGTINCNNAKQAALIAAAPELLEALQHAINRLETFKKYGEDMQSSKDVCLDDAISIMQTAIAKAKGEL